jgi:cell wall integrity and stress response component
MPTALPTIAPTFTPTATPTATPTQVPTAQPTKQTSPVLQFSSNLTLAGLTSPTLDTLSQQVVVNTTAISMAIASKYVSFLGQTAVPSVSVSIVKLEKKINTDGTYSVIASTLTKIPTSNPDSLYTSLTTALDNAVSSGQFSTTLQEVGDAAGDTQTANAQCTGVSNSAPIISYPPSSSNNSNGLSGGAIAGIVIGVLAGVALIGAAIYYYLFIMEKGAEKPLVDRALPSNTTKKDVEVLL